tara:strand:- start:2 stop:190 length:189 start_codon:yes stop_codon:yes gene_type:complete
MGIGNVMALAISMMTETAFWDMFQKKHNSKYYNAKKKTQKKKTKNKKTSRAKSTKRHPISKV